MSKNLASVNGNGLLEELRALAECLACQIDKCKNGTMEELKLLPGLSRQYRETVVKIDALESGTNNDDEIATIILRNRQSSTN